MTLVEGKPAMKEGTLNVDPVPANVPIDTAMAPNIRFKILIERERAASF